MDDPSLVTALIEKVRATTGAYLEASARRLTRCSRLLGRFTEACLSWKEGRVQNARQITETVNELLIAKCFLQDPLCYDVEYEPLADTKRTIDFLFRTTEGNRIFYDVKTVLPDDRDAMNRYETAKREERFTPDTELVLEGELRSGTLAHHHFASREKFLDHTLDLEEKIRFVPAREDGRTYFRMVFCGDGFIRAC